MDKMIELKLTSFSILSLSFFGLLLSGLIGPFIPAAQVILYRFVFIVLEYCVRLGGVTIPAVVVRIEFTPLRVVVSWTLNPMGRRCFHTVPLGLGLSHELLEGGDLAPTAVRAFPTSCFPLVGFAFFLLLLDGVLLLLLFLSLPPVVTFLVGIGIRRFVVPTLPTPYFFPQSPQFLCERNWESGSGCGTSILLHTCVICQH